MTKYTLLTPNVLKSLFCLFCNLSVICFIYLCVCLFVCVFVWVLVFVVISVSGLIAPIFCIVKKYSLLCIPLERNKIFLIAIVPRT